MLRWEGFGVGPPNTVLLVLSASIPLGSLSS